MLKRIQNKVAESRFSMPVVSAYALAVWLATGLLIPQVPMSTTLLWEGAWVQLVCFAVSAYLMIELNNSNVLIRVYSRMISCSFLMMMCSASFLLGNMRGEIVMLSVIAAYIVLFRTFQDKQAAGWTYYAFLCFGLASVAWVQMLFFVPLLWLLMWTQLSSLSWRTLSASLLGLITPYWFIAAVLVFLGDLRLLVSHFVQLAETPFPYDYGLLRPCEILVFAFVVLLFVTGSIHFMRHRSDDKIRIRLLYGFFMSMGLATIVFLVLQPQHYSPLMQLLIVNTSPLIAHFLTLTRTRITNIAFLVISTVCVALTIFSLLS